MGRWGLVIVLAVLSVGWLFPLSLAASWLIEWCEHEAANTHGQHSFPYLSAARSAFNVAAAWLAVVALFWSVVAGRLAFVQAEKNS